MIRKSAEVGICSHYSLCKLLPPFGSKIGGGLEWELTAVYASPNPSIRRHLWDKLDGIEVSRPWVLMGISIAS